MIDERHELADALKAVTDRTPLITRGVVNASKISHPIAWRKHELDISISQARALLDHLMLQRTKLGWGKRGDAA
jgi:hypothetical protein